MQNNAPKRKIIKKIKKIAVYALVIVVVTYFIFPIFWLVGTSLKTRAQAFSTPPLFVWEPTLRNYMTYF
jgi:ABC-type glycerol-3-phosphate transport system permease component